MKKSLSASLPSILPSGKKEDSFFEQVFDLVKLIPKGRVSTYGHIAAYLGSKMSARMVGWAMNAAHQQPSIPAHRVVNRLGMLTGKMHFSSPTEMERLLKKEGIPIQEDQVQNFQQILWDPNKELS